MTLLRSFWFFRLSPLNCNKVYSNNTKLAHSSSNSSTPSPLGVGGAASSSSMSPTAGSVVQWSQRNSAFYPVQSASSSPPQVPHHAGGQLNTVPFGFFMSQYNLWPFVYPPLQAAAAPVGAPIGAGHAFHGHQHHHHHHHQVHYQHQHVQQQIQFQSLTLQQISPDRASVDTAGTTPEKANVCEYHPYAQTRY